MTAVMNPVAEHLTTTHAAKQGVSFGWLGTGCRLGLVGVLVVMHLPMLVFIGAVAAAGVLVRKAK